MTRLDARSWLAVTLAGGLAATCLSVVVHRSVYAAEARGAKAAAKPTIDLEEKGAFPLPAHLESADIAAGKHDFEHLFKSGDALFHTAFNGLDGVGVAALANGSKINRFTVTPPGGNPLAISAQSCGGCHRSPFGASAGPAQTQIAFDNDQDGKAPFNVRSTTSLFGDGILQLLAQEITEDLLREREAAAAEAKKAPGKAVERKLQSKGVSYGTLIATADATGQVKFDGSKLEGVDPDLVVRPMGWKGGIPTVRLNTMAPAVAAMGMQSEELVWRIPGGDQLRDLDGDGVVRELSVGDITAMTVYTAAQETPQSFARLAELGYVQAPTKEQSAQIERGRTAFQAARCATCHLPEMRLQNTVFEEPTARGGGNYHDKLLASKDPGYSPQHPVRFDLLEDAQEPRVEADPKGGAIVRLYGDLKRHRMGRHLADPGGPTPPFVAEFAPLQIDGTVVLIAPDVFMTPELWGVGNTAPYLHDGRAGSLREAVMLHGEDSPVAAGDAGRSEAQESRDAFAALPAAQQTDLLAFLYSLRTFSPEGPAQTE
ncbi:MAG TPA: di-heme oxidoredictase family protein [Thermoanaerobaculia bacterium]|jgi:mono/diheme cytochrome c family protein|nr:di-heme oxidoredictase family protein [Thermoanaerobaculia bacterium]